jgi:hypothetical protein
LVPISGRSAGHGIGATRTLIAGGFTISVDIETSKLNMATDLDADHLPVFDTVINGKTVIGSIVGTRAEVNESIDDVLAGRIPARRLPVLIAARHSCRPDGRGEVIAGVWKMAGFTPCACH